MDHGFRKFGRYFLLDQIGQGGMARVFRARLIAQHEAHRILAIKMIQSHISEKSDFRRLFKREIALTASLNHPNIVSVYDYGEFEDCPFIVMEFIEGKNLNQIQEKFQKSNLKVPIEMTLFILDKTLDALVYAHNFLEKLTGITKNIVHRDISPQNIILSYDGIVKVIDFGIARTNLEKDKTTVGVITGKLNYMSPEQFRGHKIDERSDIFCLGIVMWELLAHRRLFDSENISEVIEMVTNENKLLSPPSYWNSDVDSDLDEICMKALQKNPENRYQTAQEMQADLKKFIQNLSSPMPERAISGHLYSLFKHEIERDRKELKIINENVNNHLSSKDNWPPSVDKTELIKIQDVQNKDNHSPSSSHSILSKLEITSGLILVIIIFFIGYKVNISKFNIVNIRGFLEQSSSDLKSQNVQNIVDASPEKLAVAGLIGPSTMVFNDGKIYLKGISTKNQKLEIYRSKSSSPGSDFELLDINDPVRTQLGSFAFEISKPSDKEIQNLAHLKVEPIMPIYEQNIVEAPQIFKNDKNGLYYFFYSTGQCCQEPNHYKIHVMYAETIEGLKRDFHKEPLNPKQITFPSYSFDGQVLEARGNSNVVIWGQEIVMFYNKIKFIGSRLVQDTYYRTLKFNPDGSVVPFYDQLRDEAKFARPVKIDQINSLCLDNTNNSLKQILVRLWNCNGHQSQDWDWIKMASNEFIIRNRYNGLCLDVANWSLKSGDPILQWQCRGTTNQLFSRIDNEGAAFKIKSKYSNLCIHPLGSEAGFNVIQYECDKSTLWSY